jgi:hypothetical protein
MSLSVDVWLRGTISATTETIDGVPGPASAWTEREVRLVLEGMLRAMDRRKRPGEAERPIALRGLSWIVNQYQDGDAGGVVIALEITLGAAVAGPFDIDKGVLEGMIARVIGESGEQPSTTVH